MAGTLTTRLFATWLKRRGPGSSRCLTTDAGCLASRMTPQSWPPWTSRWRSTTITFQGRQVTTPPNHFVCLYLKDADGVRQPPPYIIYLWGVGAPHQCPLGLVTSYLMYADVRLHIPMTHKNDAGCHQSRCWRQRYCHNRGWRHLRRRARQICSSVPLGGEGRVWHGSRSDIYEASADHV